jgi:hypothetical protein
VLAFSCRQNDSAASTNSNVTVPMAIAVAWRMKKFSVVGLAVLIPYPSSMLQIDANCSAILLFAQSQSHPSLLFSYITEVDGRGMAFSRWAWLLLLCELLQFIDDRGWHIAKEDEKSFQHRERAVRWCRFGNVVIRRSIEKTARSSVASEYI